MALTATAAPATPAADPHSADVASIAPQHQPFEEMAHHFHHMWA